MLGVFFFIVKNRTNQNTLGKEIHDSWYIDPKNMVGTNYIGIPPEKTKKISLKIRFNDTSDVNQSPFGIVEPPTQKENAIVNDNEELSNTAMPYADITVQSGNYNYKDELQKSYAIFNKLLGSNNITKAIEQAIVDTKNLNLCFPHKIYTKIYTFALDLFSILDPSYTDSTIDTSWCKNPISNPTAKPDIYASDIPDRIKETKSKLNTFFSTEFPDIFYKAETISQQA